MIGMDHYALPEDELSKALKNKTLHRNFMGYTTMHNMAQIGVGVSAISDFGNSYWQNTKDLYKYLEETSNDELNPRRSIHLDPEDQLRRKVIETLMCHRVINLMEFEEIFKIDFKNHFAKEYLELRQFEREGLLEINKNKIELTELGILFIRNLAMPFDRYLKSQSNENFSKTI